LLAAILVGVSGATSRAEPQTVTGTIMIPAAAFGPVDGQNTWSSPDDNRLMGTGAFRAPAEFPVPLVSVRRITLYAGDGSAVMNVCAHLFRSAPATGAFVETGFTCTVYPAPGDPQASFSTDISPRRVDTRLHGSFVLVNLYPNLSLYGVQITYAYEAGS
jgi:hypothetical protein